MKLQLNKTPKFSTALSICASAVLVGALCTTPTLAAPSADKGANASSSKSTSANSAKARNANSAKNANLTKANNTAQATRNKAQTKNAKASSAKNTKAAAPKSANVKAPPSTKTSAQTRGKSKTYGLMPSTLDNQGHNVYHADSDAIRGARDTESALRYMPFVTIVNTAGFGQQFDLRGQGRLSAGGVKFLINGVSFNPLDSYYGFMPINTVLPTLTQEISVSPSVGSRGGTINVITSKRFDKPYFSVGVGYANTIATTGSTFNAHAQAAENFGFVKLNAGVGYFSKGGPREDDSSTGGQAVLGALLNLGAGQSISVDADFYTAKDKTTPYNSFWDSEKVAGIVRNIGIAANRDPNHGLDTLTYTQEQNAVPQILALQAFKPSKDDRKNKAQGEIESSHKRFVGSVGYHSEPTKQLKIDLTGFYAFDKRQYDKYNSTTLLYQYGGRYFIGTETNPNSIDQSGSSFDEQKYGAKAQIDWLHTNGELIFALESVFEKAKRNPKQLLSTSKIDSVANQNSSDTRQWLEFDISTPLNISKWSNAVYFLENYKFSKQFSTALGVRYEMTKSKIDSTGEIQGEILFNTGITLPSVKTPFDKSLEANHDNFAVEVAPAFHYSDTGTLYGRYELGFSAVPSYAMLVRKGDFDLSNNTQIGGATSFTMEETNLDDETYHSFEVGFKDYVPNRQIRLGNFNLTIDAILFSANAFYIASKNEFYFTGDPYAGLDYATYDKSRRMGAEVALEQYFFGGDLGFNESFTYIKAQKKEKGVSEWTQVPYTYDYKATFGANVNVAGFFNIKFMQADLWMQNSFYGKQAVVSSIADEKLDPYMISDVGVSFGFMKGAALITAGVKNVFDTLYYDYYNNDKSASIGEYRYLLGQGRTIFVEGRFNY